MKGIRNMTIETIERTETNTMLYTQLEHRILSAVNEEFDNLDPNFNYPHDTELSVTFLKGVLFGYRELLKDCEQLEKLDHLLYQLDQSCLSGNSFTQYQLNEGQYWRCYKLYERYTGLTPQWRYIPVGQTQLTKIKDCTKFM